VGAIPDDVIQFLNYSNPSSRFVDLGSDEHPVEMSMRNLPESKGRPARKAENLIAIYEFTV
jgi:hypothetical protein